MWMDNPKRSGVHNAANSRDGVKNTIVLISTISIVYMATMHSTICALDQGLEPKTIATGKQYSWSCTRQGQLDRRTNVRQRGHNPSQSECRWNLTHPSIHYRHYIILHSIPLHDMTAHHITLYAHPHIHPIIHADGQTGSQAVRHTYSHSIPIPAPTVLCFKSARFPISLDIFHDERKQQSKSVGLAQIRAASVSEENIDGRPLADAAERSEEARQPWP